MSSKGQSLAGNWIGGCGVEMGPLGPRRRPQRAGWARPRPDPGSRFASALTATGLGWPCSSICGFVCIMLSVVYLHGTYPPSRLWGLSEVQNLAKRDRPSILWGKRDKRDGNLGSACRCRPSDAGRVYLTSHQVRWPARKHAGIQGCRCEQVGSLSEREGWMDSVREKCWSLAPLWPTWVGRAGWSQ